MREFKSLLETIKNRFDTLDKHEMEAAFGPSRVSDRNPSHTGSSEKMRMYWLVSLGSSGHLQA